MLEVAFGVDVEDHGEALIEDHFYGGVEIGEIVGGNTVGFIVAEHRLGVHAQANVIEVHGFDEGDVLGGGPGFEVLFGVALRVVDLREPFTEVDAVAEMGGATMGQGRVLREERSGCQGEEKKGAQKKAGGHQARP